MNALQTKFSKDLIVLGFPCNQFGQVSRGVNLNNNNKLKIYVTKFNYSYRVIHGETQKFSEYVLPVKIYIKNRINQGPKTPCFLSLPLGFIN